MRLSTAKTLMCPAGGTAGEPPIPKDPAAKGQRRTASPQAGKVRPAARGKTACLPKRAFALCKKEKSLRPPNGWLSGASGASVRCSQG